MKTQFPNYTLTKAERELVEWFEAQTGWDMGGEVIYDSSNVTSAEDFRKLYGYFLNKFREWAEDIHHSIEGSFRNYLNKNKDYNSY